MVNEITFDKLPQAVGYLTEQVERIHKIVVALQSQTTIDKHRIVEIDEACKITHKAKPTIYTLARKGIIPAYKRGKKLYFYEDELLTDKEVAHILKVSRRTLQDYRNNGILSYIQVGGKILYRTSDVQRTIMSGFKEAYRLKDT